MDTIFRKTAKGVAEIETRAHKLPQRLRSLLILVDGRRDMAALAALAPQGEQTLALLAAQSFIESVTRSRVQSATPSPAELSARPQVDFEAQRRAIVRALNDALGPAAEGVALKFERTRNLQEMRPLLLQAVQLLSTMRGRAAGDAFAARFMVDGGP